MRTFLWRTGVWGSVILLIVVLAHEFGDARAMWVALSLCLILALVFHLFHLMLLLRWLREPRSATIPEGFGSWRPVFAQLYRQARTQTHSHQKLANTLERFVSAGEAMPDGVVVLDEYGRIEWLNPMAVAHFGLDRQRDVGNQLINLLRQPSLHEYLQQPQHSQPLLLKQVQPQELSLSIQLVPFDFTRKLLLSSDITQLERVQTVHRDFVANVSHELRTPLTVIGGFVETLSDMDEPDPLAFKQFLPLMMEQTRRMQALVEGLLTLSRLESGAARLAVQEKVEMTALLNTLLAEAQGLSQGQHTLILEASDEPSWLWGIENELHSALGNLVSNAVRYTPPGGRIVLHWQVTQEGARFSVTDTGIGIAAPHIPRLTERFYRVERGRSRDSGGTGLGLAIVKHVLLHHQARLEIQSKPGHGSTFSVYFSPQQVVLHVFNSSM